MVSIRKQAKMIRTYVEKNKDTLRRRYGGSYLSLFVDDHRVNVAYASKDPVKLNGGMKVEFDNRFIIIGTIDSILNPDALFLDGGNNE